MSIPALAVHATGDPWVAALGVERAYRQVGLAPRRLVPVAAEVHDLGDDHGAALTALELLTQAVCSADPGHLEAVNVPGVGELLETIVAEAAWQASQAQELVAG